MLISTKKILMLIFLTSVPTWDICEHFSNVMNEAKRIVLYSLPPIINEYFVHFTHIKKGLVN